MKNQKACIFFSPARYFISFIAFIFLFSAVSAKDKITYGFERLDIHDYFSARENFIFSLKKQPVPAYYGLSIICARNNNPFYNLDSARIFILKADSMFRYLTTEEEATLNKKYRLTAFRISSQKDSIVAIAFTDALKKNSILEWNNFIENYRWSVISDSATTRRNELAFSEAKSKNTSDGYKDFYTLYPYSFQSSEARKRYEDRFFREKIANGDELSFDAFVRDNPESPYRMQAEDSLYAVATKSKTPESYYKFAKKYPTNRNTSSAWMKLYHRYLELYSVKDLSDFFNRYPDFKYRKQIEEDYRLSNIALLPARKNNRFTFITEDGRQIIPNLYDDVDEFSEGLCAVNRNGKYGYISKKGKLEIDFLFDGKASVINRDGELLVKPLYDEVGAPIDDRILFLDSMKYGYLDTHGKVVIAPQFEIAYDFSHGLAVAGREEELGVIDLNGLWGIPAKYEAVSIESNGLIHVEKDEQSGLLNRIGEELLAVKYDAVGVFSSGLALVSQEEKFGYADASGRIVIPIRYDFNRQMMGRSEFNHGFAKVREKGKSGLIDSTGNIIIPCQYDDINFYSPELPIAARKKNKWGFIDRENKVIIPLKFDLVNSFSDGLAVVKIAKLFGAIDRNGNIAIQAKWEFLSSFKNGVAFVKKDGGFGLLSSSSTLLVECIYEKYQWVTDSVIRFERNNRFGYYNTLKKEWIWKEDGF
ncbi:MAG: WG repeat-containing protein [Bacteroidetes bacterium]|nr:WG repeat-containing protein [Bacteroidota bacterium]